MDGRALRYVPALIALARERHFGRAAVALGLSQSVVSRQIAELEAALGFMLVKRSTRQVELTPTGDRLVAGLDTGLAAIDSALAEAREIAKGRKGVVRIGYTRVAIILVGGKSVQTLRKAYPDIVIELHEMGTNAQIEALRRDEIDIGLLHPPIDDSGLDLRHIASDEIGVALPLTHALAGADEIDIDQIFNEAVILYPRSVGPVLYDGIARLYRDAGRDLEVAQSCTSWEAAVDIAASGLGIAWVPKAVASAQANKVRYVSVTGEVPRLQLAVVTRRAGRHHPSRMLADRIGAASSGG